MPDAAAITHEPQPDGEQECPRCQAKMPVYTGYITWCENCGWNLHLEEPDPPNNRFEAIYASINRRLSTGLFNKLLKAHSLKPTLTWSKILAYIIAGLVHGLTLVLVVLGIWLTLFSWPYLILTAIGLGLLGASWLLAPRPARLPKESRIISREDFPALYALVDKVAELLNARHVDAIVVDEEYNAAFGQFGWTRKKVLFIGLPLFSVLESQEKVGVIAHELAHNINGDPTRGFFIGTAVNSLVAWYGIIYPDSVTPTAEGYGGLGGGCVMPANLILRGLAQPILWLVHALANLLWRDSQRAEYLADALAASVAGTNAQISSLEKFQFRHAFEVATQRAAMYFKTEDLFYELRERVRRAPRRERERINRVAKLPTPDIVTTHPPMAYRIEMLHTHPVASPKVVLTEEEAKQIDKELSALEPEMQEKIVQTYEESFY
jgi:Zn-dependent protease with chaperone function